MTTEQDGTSPTHKPQVERVETCWRMRSRQTGDRVLECAIYSSAMGLELRASYSPDDLLKSELFVDAPNTEDADRRARAVAEQWRKQVIATLGLEQLPTWGTQD
jgi:hypothetical protein